MNKAQEFLKVLESLNKEDKYAWCKKTAKYIDEKYPELKKIGVSIAIKEISNSDERAIKNYMKNLIHHLMKVKKYQKLTTSWERTIRNSRDHIQEYIDSAPSLRKVATDAAKSEKVFLRARRAAEQETGDKMPDKNPFTVDQLFDDEFYVGIKK
jgi:hypothetical protein